MRFRIVAVVVLCAVLSLSLFACGEKETAYNTNLVENGSFERVGPDGIPEGWQISLFRGPAGEEAARYGVDNTTATDGNNSFSFWADRATRRWYLLSQEIEVKDVARVRLEGWLQTDQIRLNPDQFAQSNFFLAFYDENHVRFQEMRRGDKRTRPKQGTHLWAKEEAEFRLPVGTRYVEVGCILGTEGKIWFDDVSVSVPKPIAWESRTTENYVYHWMPGHPPPEGAIENQQRIFDFYESRLGIDSDVVVKYYLYPDTATIREKLGLKGYQYPSWTDVEFHSINPNDDHEVVHFITDPYGMPPKSIAEGTVYWLQGTWQGRPVDELAAYFLSQGQLASLNDLTTYNNFHILDPNLSYPAAAAFVTFIASRFGTEKLMELYTALHGVNNYETFAAAFEKVYGITAVEAEQAFRVALARVDFSKMLENEARMMEEEQ